MKIEKVKISRFRSVEKGEFLFNKVTAIVGQNNSGKSALMRALNSFFNPNQELNAYIDGTNLYTSKRTIPRIIITFTKVPNKAFYRPYLQNGKIIIKQEYRKSRKRLEYFALQNGDYVSIPDNQILELFKDIQFILIPTDRAAKHNIGSETSVLKRLLDNFFSIHTAKRDNLTPKVKTAFNYLKNNALSKVAKGIENQYLADKGFSIKIDSRFPISYDLFINDLNVKIVEESKEFSLEECGSGIQSLVAISIHKYLAELNHTNFIVGIEEPEINLHPQAQKELIFTLLDEVNENDLQIIFTTHSTVLIDQLDHSDIVLVRKENDSTRKFKTTIQQIENDFWTKYDLQVIQYNKFHRFKNSEFFFANHVMVTESPTDSEIFRKLLADKNIIIERHGISVLELGGITSLKYAFYLLRDLNIPKTMIIDKDYFFAYQNDSKNDSRYGSGLFNYTTTFKNDDLIQELFPDEAKRIQIENLLTTNHSRALDKTLEYDVLCMRFNLEMDLVTSATAQTLIYDYLRIPMADRNTYHLLVNHDGALKKLPLLQNTISNLPQRNLPNSYKKIIRRFKAITQ